MDITSALSMWWTTIVKLKVKISPENKAVSISYNNRLQGDKRVEISWLNGEKRLRHAGRYLKLAAENQAVIESSKVLQ